MGKSVLFVILAVTKTFDKYCIAGMDSNGNWIRPLPVGTGKFWSTIFYNNMKPIQVGDVWEISNFRAEYDSSSPGHTEDIRLITEPVFKQHLSNEELINFVNKHKEDMKALNDTLDANARSLCLIDVDEFEYFMALNDFSQKTSPRMTFSYQGEEYKNVTRSITGYPITDLKWRAYTIQNKQTTGSFKSILICVGLARTEPKKDMNKEYPMIISVITDPEVPLLPTYPN